MKRNSIIPIRWIPENHDTDQDGVPNYRDCNPWNPYEHRKPSWEDWYDLEDKKKKKKSQKEKKRKKQTSWQEQEREEERKYLKELKFRQAAISRDPRVSSLPTISHKEMGKIVSNIKKYEMNEPYLKRERIRRRLMSGESEESAYND